MRFSKEFRQIARNALKGCYWLAFAVSLTAAVLGGVAGSGFGFGSFIRYSFGDEDIRLNVLSMPIAKPLLTIIILLAVIAGVAVLVQFIIGGPIRVGMCSYYLGVIDRRDERFSTLFTGFDIFGKALGLRLLTIFKTFLWTLVLVVPGIVATFRYAMAPFILAEHPEIGAKEALYRSKKMMHGNKGRLFKLYLSFIGWAVLAVLTFGLGNFFLAPYVETAVAAFYLEVSGQSYRLESCGA